MKFFKSRFALAGALATVIFFLLNTVFDLIILLTFHKNALQRIIIGYNLRYADIWDLNNLQYGKVALGFLMFMLKAFVIAYIVFFIFAYLYNYIVSKFNLNSINNNLSPIALVLSGELTLIVLYIYSIFFIPLLRNSVLTYITFFIYLSILMYIFAIVYNFINNITNKRLKAYYLSIRSLLSSGTFLILVMLIIQKIFSNSPSSLKAFFVPTLLFIIPGIISLFALATIYNYLIKIKINKDSNN